MTTSDSDTVTKQSNPIPNSKPFVKGDPRINRKGRPKSFDALRKLAQSLADEPAKGKDGAPIVVDDHIATQAEMIMRAMMKDNPERFVEIAYGKVPDRLEHSGPEGGPMTTKIVVEYDTERIQSETPKPTLESGDVHSELGEAESD